MKSGRIRAIGIDLGTTNSAVTEIVWDPYSGFSSGAGAGQIIPPALRTLEIEQPTREGVFTSPLIPSVVAILPDGRFWPRQCTESDGKGRNSQLEAL
jgi:molecular chaperone DnaK